VAIAEQKLGKRGTMLNNSIGRVSLKTLLYARKLATLGRAQATAVALSLTIMTGCQTPEPSPTHFSEYNPKEATSIPVSDVIVLHEGDSVRVSFPGAPNLNTVQQIRRDGRITLPLIGEFKATDLTPVEMEKELIKLYGPQLQTKEVNVAVDSSAFVVYVTGAVLRPGRIVSDRPMTALEAIMEAGGFDYTKANMKKVVVIRHENGRTEHHLLNLKKVLHGEPDEPFGLKRSDIIFVPERFAWF
jgi:polysaccharide export outer membrane protein